MQDGIKYHTKYEILSDISVNSATVLYSNLPLENSTIQSDNKNLYKFLANDYNGDGRDDILLSNSSIENVSSTEKPLKLGGIAINYTSSSNYSPANFSSPGNYQYSKKGNFFIPGDFNGDGNQDYILILSTYPINRYPNPYGYSYKAFLTSPSLNVVNSEILDFGSPVAGIRYSETDAGNVADADNVIPLDFDGDGKNEILVVNNQQASILNISATDPSSGYLFQNSILLTVTTITKDSKLFPGDFNGDRKTDLLVRNSNGTWTIMYSTGKAFTSVPFSFNQTVNLTGVYSDDKIVVGDFNGDGRSDILHGYSYFVGGIASTSKLSLNGTASENVNTYDSYGNVTTNVVKTGTLSGTSVSPIETTTTTTTYGIHNTPVAAKPDEVTITNLRSGTPISNTTKFYYTTNGLVSSQVEFEGLPKSVTTSFAYNDVGNLTQTTKSSTGMNNRISNMTYDPRGIFIVSRQITGTGVSQTESFNKDYLFGNTLSHTSSDCLTTTFEYDAFGRLEKTTLPEGYSINNSLDWDVQAETAFNSFTDYPDGSPDVKKWFDKLGREIKKETGGFNSKKLTQLTTYDAKGNVATSTNNYYPSETPIITTNTYDAYNRLTTVTNPLTTVTTTYTPQNGGKMQVETHDATGQTSTKIYDATGKTITAIDKGGQLDYTYDSRGNQTQVKHGSNILITNTYDDYGRQLTVADKNAGTVSYEYDAYGQLKKQTDNNGNVYVMQYDDFGRITNRQGPEGTTSYEYYKDVATGCSNNNLAKVTGFNQTIKEYTFDELKRPATEKVTIDGVPYITQYNYNSYNNLIKITYPSGVVVNNTYGTNGELLSVSSGSSTSPTTLFTGTEMDGFGNYTDYTLGNNKASQNTYTYRMPVRLYTQGIQDLNQTFDYAKGNLLSRQDAIRSITENFGYDPLNRLTKSNVNSVVQLNMAYDGSGTFSMGNITSKTDAGSYVYKSDKLHAVAYITNPAGAQTPPANISTAEQNISYTPYLKTASITEGAYQMDYAYGPDYERVKSILKQNSAIIETKYYLGSYEKQVSGGVTREIHYVSGGNGLCAMIVRQGGVNIFYFVYTDQLGSILAVTDINGTKVAEQNFDAWGRNRNPANWQYASVPVNPVWLYRGYTGHEHVPQFSLINMNGRMYDPIEGRMLSPDNYVSDAFNSQAYNRYTYALNNPLSYVDPDGNFPFLVVAIAAAIGAYSGGSVANGGQLNPAKWDWSSGRTWGSVIGGALIGGASGGLGSMIANSGAVFANTGALVFGSFTNSIGMAALTGGQMSPGVSFGIVSYDFNSREVGYLGKKGNGFLGNLGYSLGLLANVQDALAGLRPKSVLLETEKLDNETNGGQKDLIGHTQIVGKDGNVLIDYGPKESGTGSFIGFSPARNNWEEYVNETANVQVINKTGNIYNKAVEIKGVNVARLQRIATRLNANAGKYNFLLKSCSSVASRSLFMSGVSLFGGIHPYSLRFSALLRSQGLRLSSLSYFTNYGQ